MLRHNASVWVKCKCRGQVYIRSSKGLRKYFESGSLAGIQPTHANRLSKALGCSPESWLTMQGNYDLWQAKQTVDLKKIRKIESRYAP